MADRELRSELEQVYDAFRASLVVGDLDAYLATGADPDTVVDSSRMETARNEFPEAATMLLRFGYPPRGEVEFVDARSDGDHAGYYFRAPDREDPEFVRLSVVRFHLDGGRWIPTGDDWDETFRPASAARLEAEIGERIDRSPEFAVFRPPALRPISGPPEGADPGIEGVLNVVAYGYEVNVLVNDLDADVHGGGASSMRLIGALPGAAPGHPYILARGRNRLLVRYRRVAHGSPYPLTVSLRIADELPSVFLLATRKGPAEFAAEFAVPLHGSDQVEPVYLWDGEAGPGVFVHVDSTEFAVETVLNGEAGPSVVGMSDTLAIPGPRPGPNELVVSARALSPPAVLRAAVVAPVGVRWFERVAETTDEWSETFTFAFEPEGSRERI